MTTLPDGSALAADRDRLARPVAREWKLLEHHLPAGHYLFAAEEVPLELDIFTHHDELGLLIGCSEGEHIAVTDMRRQRRYAVVTHADGETYAYEANVSSEPYVVQVSQRG
jgi:hypothetical protein